MTHSLLHQRFLERKTEAAGLLSRLLELTDRAGRGDLRETVSELLSGIGDPFLFVVVGEVKTGKSSLVNALLGEEICPVAPDPCTDRIRIMTYGEARREAEDSPLLTRVFLPGDILREIAIVDTPGVDSIIDRHQEITEQFIPRCDLVLFVFSAINPYSRSAWEFFDLVRAEWRRKIVFVLNQADLASEEQLAVNERSVRDLAMERGVAEPLVFPTSGRIGAADPEKGGVAALRTYIREMVTGGEHYRHKLLAAVRAAENVLGQIGRGLDAEALELDEDRNEAGRIRDGLESARRASDREVEHLVGRVTAAYAKLCMELVDGVEAELTFVNMLSRTVAGLFRRKGEKAIHGRVRELTETFETSLERDVENITRQGAQYVSEVVADRIRPLLDELERRAGRNGGRADPTALSRRRDEVLTEVVEGVSGLLRNGSPLSGMSPKKLEGMDPKAAMGSMLVVLGAVFAVSVKSVVVDITGGVVAGAGMVLAGSALAWNRPRVLGKLKQGLAQAGGTLESELTERLAAHMDHVFGEFEARFEPFFDHIVGKEAELAVLFEKRTELAAALAALDQGVLRERGGR